MTSHRMLATSGLLRMCLPAITAEEQLRARIEHRLERAGYDPARVEVEVLHGYVRIRVRRPR